MFYKAVVLAAVMSFTATASYAKTSYPLTSFQSKQACEMQEFRHGNRLSDVLIETADRDWSIACYDNGSVHPIYTPSDTTVIEA